MYFFTLFYILIHFCKKINKNRKKCIKYCVFYKKIYNDSILIILGGVVFFKFQNISEYFSSFTGMKAVVSLLTGDEIVEITGNTNEQLLMVKRDDKIDTYIGNLNSEGYVCKSIGNDDFNCEKNGENFFVASECYTRYFTIFKLEKDDNTL